MEVKKKISLEIDGVIYTPVYNYNTFARFGELYGLTIDDFSKMNNPSFKQLLDIAFLGIQEFCRINKMDLNFDRYRIGELETEKISLLISSISANMMPLPNTGGN